jgi:hypothetical protein
VVISEEGAHKGEISGKNATVDGLIGKTSKALRLRADPANGGRGPTELLFRDESIRFAPFSCIALLEQCGSAGASEPSSPFCRAVVLPVYFHPAFHDLFYRSFYRAAWEQGKGVRTQNCSGFSFLLFL